MLSQIKYLDVFIVRPGLQKPEQNCLRFKMPDVRCLRFKIITLSDNTKNALD